MEATFTGQLSVILSIVGGVIAILAFLRQNANSEKNNAVEIANLKKDVEAQRAASMTIRDEMRAENQHLQKDIVSVQRGLEIVAQTVNKISETQSNTSGDIKAIMVKLDINKK